MSVTLEATALVLAGVAGALLAQIPDPQAVNTLGGPVAYIALASSVVGIGLVGLLVKNLIRSNERATEINAQQTVLMQELVASMRRTEASNSELLTVSRRTETLAARHVHIAEEWQKEGVRKSDIPPRGNR